MKTKQRRTFNQKQRRELLELYHRSGYTRNRFCEQMGLSYPTLKRWLDQDGSLSLVEVQSVAEPQESSPLLKVHLPGQIQCDYQGSVEETAKLIKALM